MTIAEEDNKNFLQNPLTESILHLKKYETCSILSTVWFLCCLRRLRIDVKDSTICALIKTPLPKAVWHCLY